MKVSLVWTVITLAALEFPQAAAFTRDLQETGESTPTLSKTQAQIAMCPQCRSAEEIQKTGFLRSLFTHAILWWISRRNGQTWFINALQDKEIPVDPSQWTDLAEQWTTTAQILRQQEADASDTTTPEITQYEYLLTDLLASSLEAGTTLMDLVRDDLTDNTASMTSYSCRIVAMNDFVNRVVLSNIALVMNEMYSLSSGESVDALSSIIQPTTLDNKDGRTPVLDQFKETLLNFCAESDESFVQLRDVASALTMDLDDKKDTFIQYSANLGLPSFSTIICSLVKRIEYVLRSIVLFPLLWFLSIPAFVYIFLSYYLHLPDWQIVIAEALLLLILIILFPVAYIVFIVRSLLGSFQGTTGDCQATSAPLNQEALAPDLFDIMALAKKDPFAFSMKDVECQVQAISCQNDAWAQFLQ